MKGALFGALVLILGADGGTGAATLKVKVTGLKSADGSVMVALFAEAQAEKYPVKADDAFRKVFVASAAGEVIVPLEGVPLGAYAVAVFHDEDGNKKLNTGLFGIPSEGTGASRDAKGFMGPPKFPGARFVFTRDGQVVEVPVHY